MSWIEIGGNTDDHNGSLLFSTKEQEGAIFARNTGVEVLKMHYRYNHKTGTWTPEKYVIVSSYLFTAGVPVEKK